MSLFKSRPAVIYTRKADIVSKVHNPGRGFYSIFPFDIAVTVDTGALTSSLRSDQSLVLLEIDLSAYRSCDIDENALNNLHDILGFFKGKGKDMILRFTYDMIGRAKESEPDTLSRVINHMDSVGRVVKSYVKNVFLVQGLFIGNWGEMHTSGFSDEEDLKKLYRAYRLGPMGEIYLAVRTVAQLRLLLEESELLRDVLEYDGMLTPEMKKSVTKVGLFDDAMLHDSTDLGTYADYERDEALGYIHDACIKVPVGGEALLGEQECSSDEVISYMEMMRVNYINSQHDENLLSKWKETKVGEKHLYDIISDRMGYALSVESLSFDKKEGSFEIVIKNHGFGSLLETSELTIFIKRVIKKDDGQTEYLKEQRLDLRISHGTLRPDNDFIGKLYSHELPKGKYVAAITLTRLKDGHAIEFVNGDSDGLSEVAFTR